MTIVSSQSGSPAISFIIFFIGPATTEIYTLSLHDALPISPCAPAESRSGRQPAAASPRRRRPREPRSEEHTSELQSQFHLVCRLLLEKKKATSTRPTRASTRAT